MWLHTRLARATQKVADWGAQKFLGQVFGGVNKLIGLIGKTGDAFSRLTPQVAVVTCTLLLGAFALVAGFVLCHLLALALACTCSAFAEARAPLYIYTVQEGLCAM